MSTTTSVAVDMDIKRGLKLLSLGKQLRISYSEQTITSGIDAGGAQGISQLQILDHIMEKISNGTQGLSQRVVKRPCEVFDAIGGTGTGG
jgi:hypothetical protein